MKLVIYDQDDYFLKFLLKTVRNYSMFECQSISVDLASNNAPEILEFININRADCYIIDTSSNQNTCKLNGFEIASKIREKDPYAAIIFISNQLELIRFAFTFKVGALNYIFKNNQESLKQELLSTLSTAFKRYLQMGGLKKSHHFRFKIEERIKTIPIDDIYCFSSSTTPHKINLFTKDEEFQFNSQIKDLDCIDYCLFKSHKSFILNIRKIQEINLKERVVILDNGIECPVSYRKLKLLKSKLGLYSQSKQSTLS